MSHAERSISVVIPALDAADTLADQLDALKEQIGCHRFEVVVSDNGSTDDTRGVAESFRDCFERLVVVDSSARRGVSHARNAGVAAAGGEIVLICDADDIVSDAWVRQMCSALDLCDIVGGSRDEVSLNSAEVSDWRGQRNSETPPTALDFLPYAVGCNMGFRRRVFEYTGGWDEAYRAGGDDVDYSWRAQLGGARFGYVPEAVVFYRHRAGLAPLWRQFYRYGRAGPQLYRQYGRLGAKRRPIRRALRSWLWLTLKLPILLHGSRSERGKVVRVAATLAGRLAGSIRYRVIYL